MSKNKIATLVRKVEELAAITPGTEAIIVALDHDDFDSVASGLRDAVGMTLGSTAPWVIIVPGEVALTDTTCQEPEAGIFIGVNELARIIEMEAGEVKEKLLAIMRETD